MPDSVDRIEVENPSTPGRTERLDRAKYEAMRDALLPDTPPGLKVAEAKEALLPYLDENLFPGGAKAGWWLKAVQLDLEAKKIIARAEGSPVRLYRCK